jgi:hypothetical protein
VTAMMRSRLSVIIAISKIEVYLIITILVMAVYLLISFSILLSLSMVFNFFFTGSIDDGRLSSYFGRGLGWLWRFLFLISV